MKTKHLPILLLLFILAPMVQAQENYLAGYEQKINGTDFTYHSPFSYRENCLLTRARADVPPIAWKTEVVPEGYSKKTVSFIWLYGIGAKTPSNKFDLYVNKEKVMTFSSPTKNEEVRTLLGKDGVQLVFNRSMVDTNLDEMGTAVLTIPSNYFTPGNAVELMVDGVDNHSNDWFMTFDKVLSEDIKSKQLKTVTKKEGSLYHTVRFEIVHLKAPTKARITTSDLTQKFDIKTGFNEIDLLIPAVTTPTKVDAELRMGKVRKQVGFRVEPVKEWTIHLVQHSHTDIGYTRSQTEILTEHLRFIDYALDYCDQTDDYPDEAKFRWTCEAAWTVREYLKNRPKEQIDRLLQRIKEGRIEVTGMFFNFSEIIDETALAMQTQALNHFKERGIDVNTAMQNDVNGIGWAMIDLYKNTGIKYLTMGQHGHRAQVPFDKPTSFWWESNSGNRLLAYRSEHYMHGNALSLTSGELDQFRANLSQYLDGLEAKGYPHDRTAFQFSGYLTDNSPPSTKACDIVKEWNQKYEWPKLKLSLASEFMIYLDENQGDDLPVQKVAWPDWWTDGFGTAFTETKTARTVHSNMIANMGLLSMAKFMGTALPENITGDIEKAYDELLFYDEHTFGAAESITDPLIENSVIQWGQKSAYAWTAFKESSLIQEKALGLMQQHIPKAKEPTIAVFNTLNWERSGLVKAYIDHQLLPLGKPYKILDTKGNEIAVQRISSRADGSNYLLWAPNVPPMGYATFKIVLEEGKKQPKQNKEVEGPILENEYYRIQIDSKRGVVTSLFDKELYKELVDLNSGYKLGEFIYEQPDNRESMERLTNANRDTVYVPIKKKMSGLSDIKVSGIKETPLWSSIHINGKNEECADSRGVNFEIKLYKNSKRIELSYDMVKRGHTAPEGVFIALPFRMKDNDQLAFDVQGGIVNPGMNQLEGTSADWNVIQNFAAVQNDEAQILFSSNDVPLVQFGDINTGRFYYKHKPENPHIYSWVLNNYWTTNFRASQEGEMKWKYYLTSSKDRSKSFATRFGWESRVPMLSRVIPPSKSNKANSTVSKSLLDFDLPNLILVSARPLPGDKGVLLHLRETEGDHAILDVPRLLGQTGAVRAVETNVLGEEIKELTKPLLIEHYETRFVLLKML
ncbi:glycoside hydrolase family 38 C-terminal domain-containing protein [Maribacter polysiphoniae]|uniref:glycoside hydrolase family 38 N-terminal domain-containing protein n=1 Tax=Maribacter polysiphoniae TaxID=429344 RepID=UPI002354AD17|nr:glycoside hydrolase family 38 C-terminal domain-containing protein [Maribacter polysiphoniae]